MHIVITGASGLVGRALTARILAHHSDGANGLQMLTLWDVGLAREQIAPKVCSIGASIADAGVVKQVFERPVDVVYHLASIPGGTAERDYELGRTVNVDGTLRLLEAAKAQVEEGGRAPRFVFASTIGIFGVPMPDVVDDQTPACPGMTYGAQKLMGEIAVADFTRRGWCDGLSLRLPGVLARPPAPSGLMSAFISDMVRDTPAGIDVICPMNPDATTWAASTPNVVDNLLLAAEVPTDGLPVHRVFTLPALRFSMDDLVDALVAVHGPEVRKHVIFAPDARIEELFGRFPILRTPAAEAIGFRCDEDLVTLVRRAIEFV